MDWWLSIAKTRPKSVLTAVNRKINICLDAEHFSCLAPEKWINDEIINLSMGLIAERDAAIAAQTGRQASHFFLPAFMAKLLQSDREYAYNNVRRWTKSVDVFGCAKIFVPINTDNIHWTLAVLRPAGKTITYYDSLGNRDRSNGHKYMTALKRWLIDEATDKLKPPEEALEWSAQFCEVLPTQGVNGTECGVFCITYADLLSDDLPLHFTLSDTVALRRKIGVDIIRSALPYPIPNPPPILLSTSPRTTPTPRTSAHAPPGPNLPSTDPVPPAPTPARTLATTRTLASGKSQAGPVADGRRTADTNAKTRPSSIQPLAGPMDSYVTRDSAGLSRIPRITNTGLNMRPTTSPPPVPAYRAISRDGSSVDNQLSPPICLICCPEYSIFAALHFSEDWSREVTEFRIAEGRELSDSVLQEASYQMWLVLTKSEAIRRSLATSSNGGCVYLAGQQLAARLSSGVNWPLDACAGEVRWMNTLKFIRNTFHDDAEGKYIAEKAALYRIRQYPDQALPKEAYGDENFLLRLKYQNGHFAEDTQMETDQLHRWYRLVFSPVDASPYLSWETLRNCGSVLPNNTLQERDHYYLAPWLRPLEEMEVSLFKKNLWTALTDKLTKAPPNV